MVAGNQISAARIHIHIGGESEIDGVSGGKEFGPIPPVIDPPRTVVDTVAGATAVLTLSEEPSANLVTQVITAFGASDTGAFRWSGDFMVAVGIDTDSGDVVVFEMLGGTVTTTDTTYTLAGDSPFAYSQAIANIDVGGEAVSDDGPEERDPPDLFDATRHGFMFSEGRTESSGTFGSSVTLLEDGPIRAFGATTGRVSMGQAAEVRSLRDGVLIAKRYPIVFSLVLDSATSDGDVSIKTTGTPAAKENATVSEHPFYEWFASNFPTEAEGPNYEREGLAWTLGLEPGGEIPLVIVGEKIIVPLLPGGSRAPVMLEWSADLESWVRLTDEIAVGSSGEFGVNFPTTDRFFVRVNGERFEGIPKIPREKSRPRCPGAAFEAGGRSF